QVITYVEQYGSSRFEDLGFEGASVANRVGFRKEREKTSEVDGRCEYLVLPLMWESELCRGYDHKAIAKEMAKRGQLLTDKGRVTCTVRCHHHGAVRVYRLAPGIINGIADATDTRTEAERRQAFVDWMMSDPDSSEA